MCPLEEEKRSEENIKIKNRIEQTNERTNEDNVDVEPAAEATTSARWQQNFYFSTIQNTQQAAL